MSRILTRTRFRSGWNGNRFIRFPAPTPSDGQFDEILNRALELYTSRRRNYGQMATLNITAGSRVVPLPLDWITTPANEQALRDASEAEVRWLLRESNLDQLNYQYYTDNLNYPNTYGSYGIAPEIQHNLSRPLRPPAPRPRRLDIQRRNIGGVIRPALILFQEAKSTATVDITYQGKHQIENASALMTVVNLPTVGQTLVIETSEIAQTTYTFVAAAPGSNEIQIAGTTTLQATNVKTALTSLGALASQAKNTLTINSADGDEFTLTVDGTKITSTYTASINTIDKEAEFFQIIEALALRGLRSQDLQNRKSITDTQIEAARLLNAALSAITPRFL